MLLLRLSSESQIASKTKTNADGSSMFPGTAAPERAGDSVRNRTYGVLRPRKIRSRCIDYNFRAARMRLLNPCFFEMRLSPY